MLRTFGAATGLGGLLCYKTSVLHPRRMTLMAEEVQFMAPPMSDLSNVTYNSDMRLRMESFIMGLQYDLCKALEAQEDGGKKFRVDRWSREEGGGGVTCIIQDGDTFEKARVCIFVSYSLLIFFPRAGGCRCERRSRPHPCLCRGPDERQG